MNDQSEGDKEDQEKKDHHRRRCHYHYYHQSSVRRFVRVGLIIVTCLALYHIVYHFLFIPKNSYTQVHECTKSIFSADTKLKEVLEKAATSDKTVIITNLNAAWAAPNSIFDLFLESFKIGNQTRWILDHLVVIALDEKAHERCLDLHLYCYVFRIGSMDFSGEAKYMSSNYVEMNWRRIDFLRAVLELGYNFIFTDADIMWFRNPFHNFYPDGDFQIACDFYRGNSTALNNLPNGGFQYVKSNNYTIKFYKFWYASRETYPGENEQDVLNIIRFYPSFSTSGMKVRFLDTAYFGGFCEPSKDLNRVCTMHANCCLGIDHKVHDLNIMLEDWRKFLSLPTDVRASELGSWRVPQNCMKN